MSGSQTILITGGTGYLGSHLLKGLIGNYRLLLLKRSSSSTRRIDDVLDKITVCNSDEAALNGIFRENKIDIILHCATDYGRNRSDDVALLEANIALPLQLLRRGREHGVSCFINTDTMLDKRVSAYALSKSHFKDWLSRYSRELTCINVSLEHFYGPSDDESKFISHVIRGVLNNVARLDLTEGHQKRDFIYIDDVVNAFLRIIDHSASLPKGFHTYEVGSGQTVTIRTVVTLIKDLANNTSTCLNFGALPYRENEVMESRVDLSEMTKLGWKSTISLEEGLRKTIAAERDTDT